MSKKQGFFILAGVGIGLVSGLSPLKVQAETFTADAKQDIKAVEHKIESVGEKIEKEFSGDKADNADKAEKTHKARTSFKKAFRTAPCDPYAIDVKFDDKDGEFAGMSHDGAELTLTNKGKTTCRVPGRAEVTFLNHRKKTLPITFQAPRGFHPGPVVAPVVLAPGAKASTNFRWVACKVFDKNVCFKPHYIAVRMQDKALRTHFKTRICGDKVKGGAVYEEGLLHVEKAKKAVKKNAPKCHACK